MSEMWLLVIGFHLPLRACFEIHSYLDLHALYLLCLLSELLPCFCLLVQSGPPHWSLYTSMENQRYSRSKTFTLPKIPYLERCLWFSFSFLHIWPQMSACPKEFPEPLFFCSLRTYVHITCNNYCYCSSRPWMGAPGGQDLASLRNVFPVCWAVFIYIW